jgi:uncharacterized protein (DUF2252 family)
VTTSIVDPDTRKRDGRALRDVVPLEDHAHVDTVDRPDPIALLTAQDATRLEELVPIRHQRMALTPFSFFRGAAAIMASDLARVPATGLRVQLCGDAHLSNFGMFHSPDRRLVFDVNDFDETLPGSFEWDLKRLAASVTVAGRNNELSGKQIRSATRAAVRGYRKGLERTVALSPLDVHYHRIEVESVLADSEQLRKRSRKAIAEATQKDSVRALDKLTEIVDGRRRIVARPPLVIPLDGHLTGDDGQRLTEFFAAYRSSLPPHRSAVLDRYQLVDVAHKVVGVGSVGTRCLIVLLESDTGSPLFLQFKEATASVLEPYLGASEFEEAGERVVRGQRLMQATGDIFLGWSRYHRPDGLEVDFYFRQLWDGKGSADVDQMGPKRLKNYAAHCGGALALAHARTGDAATITGYLGDDRAIDHVLADFAERYADLAENDHAAHLQAIASGRIDVPEG